MRNAARAAEVPTLRVVRVDTEFYIDDATGRATGLVTNAISTRVQDTELTIPGDSLSCQDVPVFFAAKHSKHAVQTWVGTRTVSVAYTVRSLLTLSSADRACLQRQGFRLPCSESPDQVDLFDQRPCRGPACFVEIFSGSAALSRACADLGFEVIAIDHKPRKSFVPAVHLDLTQPACQSACFVLLESKKPCSVHLAPPCGMCSRQLLGSNVFVVF